MIPNPPPSDLPPDGVYDCRVGAASDRRDDDGARRVALTWTIDRGPLRGRIAAVDSFRLGEERAGMVAAALGVSDDDLSARGAAAFYGRAARVQIYRRNRRDRETGALVSRMRVPYDGVFPIPRAERESAAGAAKIEGGGR